MTYAIGWSIVTRNEKCGTTKKKICQLEVIKNNWDRKGFFWGGGHLFFCQNNKTQYQENIRTFQLYHGELHSIK
jgi:hypothetical protein